MSATGLPKIYRVSSNFKEIVYNSTFVNIKSTVYVPSSNDVAVKGPYSVNEVYP